MVCPNAGNCPCRSKRIDDKPPCLDFSILGTQKTPIAKTEHRGMTLAQLRALWNFIEKHALRDGFLPGWLDRDGKTLHKDSINLYDVVKYVVNPATKEQKCSFVELVAPAGTTAQTPRWFVSHWQPKPVLHVFLIVQKYDED